MKVVILYGSSNSGKTTTIRKVFEKLEGSASNISESAISNGSKGDFEADFYYQNNHIGIFSAGDKKKMVVGAIEKYHDMNVEIFIIAYNNKFFTLPWQFLRASEIIIVEKTSDNEKDCDSIISKI